VWSELKIIFFEANCQKSTGIDIGIAMGGSLLLIIRHLGGCAEKLTIACRILDRFDARTTTTSWLTRQTIYITHTIHFMKYEHLIQHGPSA